MRALTSTLCVTPMASPEGAVAHGEMHHVAEAIVDIMRRIEARGDVEVVPRGK